MYTRWLDVPKMTPTVSNDSGYPHNWIMFKDRMGIGRYINNLRYGNQSYDYDGRTVASWYHMKWKYAQPGSINILAHYGITEFPKDPETIEDIYNILLAGARI